MNSEIRGGLIEPSPPIEVPPYVFGTATYPSRALVGDDRELKKMPQHFHWPRRVRKEVLAPCRRTLDLVPSEVRGTDRTQYFQVAFVFGNVLVNLVFKFAQQVL